VTPIPHASIGGPSPLHITPDHTQIWHKFTIRILYLND
jgi:hypothetical protein